MTSKRKWHTIQPNLQNINESFASILTMTLLIHVLSRDHWLWLLHLKQVCLVINLPCNQRPTTYECIRFRSNMVQGLIMWHLFYCKRLRSKVSYIFTALYWMQGGQEKAVCLSVWQMLALWQNGRKICPDFFTVRKFI